MVAVEEGHAIGATGCGQSREFCDKYLPLIGLERVPTMPRNWSRQRRRPMRSWGYALAAALSASFGLPAAAQSSAGPIIEETVVVTARKREENLVRLAARAVQERCPPLFVCNPSVNIRHAQGF